MLASITSTIWILFNRMWWIVLNYTYDMSVWLLIDAIKTKYTDTFISRSMDFQLNNLCHCNQQALFSENSEVLGE